MKVGWLSCAVLFCLALLTGFMATASGPGISPDSVSYISMGANVYQGYGFVTDLASPFDPQPRSAETIWPPGYSLLITTGIALGLSAVEAARVVTILCYALLLVVVFWLANNLAGRWLAILCSLTVLALMPVLRAATFALSEIPFALFFMVAIASFIQAAKPGSRRKWIWYFAAAVGTALAVLTRYVGLIFIPTGMIVLALIAFRNEKGSSSTGLQKIILPELVFLAISFGTILPWFIRNTWLTGHLTGIDRFVGSHPSFATNIFYAFGTLASQLIPAVHIGLQGWLMQNPLRGMSAVLFFLFVLAGTVFLRVRNTYRRDKTRLDGRRFFSVLQDWLVWLIPVLYALFYLFGVIILSSIQQFPDYDWPRILVVIYPLILIILLAGLARFIRVALRTASPLAREAVVSLVTLTLLVPYAFEVAGYIPLAAQGQELSTSEWRNNQGIQFLTGTAGQEDQIYSDKPAGVSYMMSRPVRFLPLSQDYDKFSDLVAHHPTGEFYIIIFKGAIGQPDPYLTQRLSADDLVKLAATHANMRCVADFSDSSVYLVQ